MLPPNYIQGNTINLVSSILKGLGLTNNYQDIPEFTKEIKTTKNVILLVLDSLGYDSLKKLGKNSFLIYYKTLCAKASFGYKFSCRSFYWQQIKSDGYHFATCYVPHHAALSLHFVTQFSTGYYKDYRKLKTGTTFLYKFIYQPNMSDDWFRNTKWDKKEKERFFERLNRSRGDLHKAQYARIKAYCLLQTKKKKLVLGCIELCKLVLEKWPNIHQLTRCFLQLAEAYAFIGKKKKAIQYFDKCLEQEKKDPSLQTSLVTTFPEFIVMNKLYDYYDKALQVLEFGNTRTCSYAWPYQFFLFFGLQALIHSYRNENEKAKNEANKALEYVEQKRSGFLHHPGLGLVPLDHWLINKLKKIK